MELSLTAGTGKGDLRMAVDVGQVGYGLLQPSDHSVSNRRAQFRVLDTGTDVHFVEFMRIDECDSTREVRYRKYDTISA